MEDYCVEVVAHSVSSGIPVWVRPHDIDADIWFIFLDLTYSMSLTALVVNYHVDISEHDFKFYC